jgi:hypothetical protein
MAYAPSKLYLVNVGLNPANCEATCEVSVKTGVVVAYVGVLTVIVVDVVKVKSDIVNVLEIGDGVFGII